MPDVPILDLHPPADDVEAEVLAGLRSDPPTLPCKLFYDDRGSRLFEAICDQPEYYPTRTEMGILEAARPEISAAVGGGVVLVEYGSGSTKKVRLLLDGLDVAAYVPIDISRWYLETAARELGEAHPGLIVRPVLADYNQDVPLPDDLPGGPRVGFFPGGTLGNFTPDLAVGFLKRVAKTLGRGGYLVTGVDLRKEPETIHAAYNDAAGATAEFNLNLLARLNRELGADFDSGQWRHYAPYAPDLGRIEMHLIAAEDQAVTVAGERFEFERGDSIHTENSYKYTPRRLAAVAGEAGFEVVRGFTDDDRLFGVQLLRVR